MDKFIAFRDKLKSDGKLAERYDGIMKRRGIAKETKFSDLDDAVIAELIEAARLGGFDFTLDEVRQYFAGGSQGELSDAELESVAGGKGSQTTVTIDLYQDETGKVVGDWTTKTKKKN
jgi:hypothetical protein